jgi:hypothetical protein
MVSLNADLLFHILQFRQSRLEHLSLIEKLKVAACLIGDAVLAPTVSKHLRRTVFNLYLFVVMRTVAVCLDGRRRKYLTVL